MTAMDALRMLFFIPMLMVFDNPKPTYNWPSLLCSLISGKSCCWEIQADWVYIFKTHLRWDVTIFCRVIFKVSELQHLVFINPLCSRKFQIHLDRQYLVTFRSCRVCFSMAHHVFYRSVSKEERPVTHVYVCAQTLAHSLSLNLSVVPRAALHRNKLPVHQCQE